jgi:hypothetical protein
MKPLRILAVLLFATLPAPILPVQAAPAGFVPGPGAQAADSQSKAPAVVFLLRHAEKPVGDDKDPNLTAQGYQRARALPALFVTTPGSNTLSRFPRPDFLFASAPAKHSNRPKETIAPLAAALDLKIDDEFADAETAPLARKILSGAYAGKVVLICWHHGEIPQLAEALGVTGAPKHWNPDVFDQLWEIRWIDGKPALLILPERLLPGDTQK